MRVLVHGINYAPELTGIGKYTSEMCAWLASRGHEVRVVTAPPYYPEWRIREGYRGWRYRREQIDGVRVERCPLWVPAKPSGAKRLLHLASFALSSLPLMLRAIGWRPHIVIVIEPPFFCAPAAWLTARLSGGKAWLHVQDLEVDAAFDLGFLPQRFKKIVMGVEQFVVRRFDRVSTISLAMMNRLLQKGLRTSQCVLFENWADCRTIVPLARASAYRQRLSLSDHAFVALYSGNIGEKQGLEIIVEAARQLMRLPKVFFVVCGDGTARRRLEALASGLPNMRWLPLQPLGELNELLNLADVHLLPQRASAADLVMPSKLTGMLASGKPVLATADQGSALAVAVSERGLVVPPGDTGAFVAALLRLKDDAGLRVVMGRNARCYAETHFAADAVLRRFEAAMQRCVEGRS